jgi:hypothetical protein
MTATEPLFSKDPTSRMLGRITGGRGGRFAGKLTEAPRDSTVFRSIAVTYTYPEPEGWSFWRTPSLIYLSFVIRTPSIEVRVRKGWPFRMNCEPDRSRLLEQTNLCTSSTSDLGLRISASSQSKTMEPLS